MTVHERLAALEALGLAELATSVTALDTRVAALEHPDTGAASQTDVVALGDRVTAVEADLGSDAPVAPVVPQQPAADQAA